MAQMLKAKTKQNKKKKPNMSNYVLYLTPLIALKISDKERAAIDIVFCPSSICVSVPRNSKYIIIFPWGRGNI